MKSALFFLLILSGAVGAVAQPTITAATTNPLAGQRFYSFDCDTTGITIGASGAAVTWDLSGLARVDTDSIMYTICSVTPYCDSFPGSTLAINDGFGYEYFITDAVKFAISGIGISGGNSIYYSDPENLISYPSTYGTVGADSYYSTEPGDSDYNYGTDSTYADAWGTLILPSGTYTNTLRLHNVNYSVDSSIAFGIPFVDSERYESYLWVTPGFHNPLLVMDVEPTGGGGFSISDVTYYTDSLHYPPPSTGIAVIPTAGGDLQVYPNPANEALHIVLNSQASELATLSITDMAGRKMDGTTSWVSVTKGVNNLNYDVSFLPPGMYMLQVHTNEGTANRKISIVR